MSDALDPAALVSGKRLLVTGASGFIGGRLLLRLTQLGAASVVALDREPLATNPWLATFDAPNASSLRLALGTCATADLERALRGVDAVFHLAAVKYRPDGEPVADIVRTNALGTAQLVEACARTGVVKVVFASSLYAYGRMHGEPFEEDETLAPRTVYGQSKRFGEELVALVRATTLRYMFVYGPGQSPKHGYPSVIVRSFVRMLAGERPVIHGDGAQVLDYVFVDDAVEATIRALAPAGDGRVYNVGSGVGMPIRALINEMRAVAGFAGAAETAPPDGTAGTRRVARVDRIRSELGWTPVTSLTAGLAATLASIRAYPERYARDGRAGVGRA
jgi:UDP-glucose 4-epimerase